MANELAGQPRINYETFFNAIDDFLFVLENGGKILYMNFTVINRLGYRPEELLGQSVLFVHPPERREEAGRIVGEMLEGKAKFCPVPLMTKSGLQIPVETRVTRGFWDGKPVLFGVTKDISKLKLSEEKFSKLFDINPAACGLSDMENHVYTEVNDAFCTLLGYKKHEVLGKSPIDLGILSPEMRDLVLSKADQFGNVKEVYADLHAKDGQVKHVLLTATNMFIQDSKLRYTVVTDITELKKSEAEIQRKNEELLRLNAEKDRFFSIIAHDLRSPFSSLLGFAHLMVDELSSLSAEDGQKMAVNMRNSATKLFDLLENLLEWSCLQRGMTNFNPVQTSLRSEVESSIHLVSEASVNKGISINSNIPAGLEVSADRKMLQSLMRNLLFNAIKFTHRGGKIDIVAKKAAGKLVEITVRDTGIGMKQAIVEKLFRIDERISRSGTEGEPSTGLGLVLSREFVEKHGGTISVESEEGKGTSIHFTLPAR